MDREISEFLSTSSSLSNNPSSSSSYTSYSSLVGSSLKLLVRTPLATKDAALAVFCHLIDLSLDKQLNRKSQSGRQSPLADQLDELLGEVGLKLQELIQEKPRDWSSVLAPWCLSVLGDLSSKYTSKLSSKGQIGGIHDSLPLWMEFKAVRLLIDLTNSCLSSLSSNSEMTEFCISALLDTSVKHTPKFDWVVAQVGGAFPETVIDRVLAVGLKDFHQSIETHASKGQIFNLSKVPKFNSVVGIVGHLASTHGKQISGSLRQMIMSSLDVSKKKSNAEMQRGSIPFILYLASLSDLLRSSLSDIVGEILKNQDMIEHIANLIPLWQEKYFNDSDESLVNMIVHLLTLCNKNGSEIVHCLFNLCSENQSREVRNGCRTLIELILADLQTLVHRSAKFNSEDMPLVSSLKNDHQFLLEKYLFSEDAFHRRTSVLLLNILSLSRGRSVSVNVVKYCILNASSDLEVSVMAEFIKETELWIPEMVGLALNQILKSNQIAHQTPLRNLIKMLQYQQLQSVDNQKVRVLSSFAKPVKDNQMELLKKCKSKALIPEMLSLFRLVPLPANADVSLVFRASHFFVHSFFVLLEDEKAFEEDQKMDLISKTMNIFTEISNSQIGLPMVFRFLMDGAINSRFAKDLFGSKISVIRVDGTKFKVEKKKNVSLMEENKKFGSMPTRSLGTSTVFHAGIIGEGKTAIDSGPRLDEEDLDFNRFTFLCALAQICNSGSKEKSKEANKQLSLLMVEMVSPDVMYNGFPWPDEEFMKVTIERDLKISKAFENHPLLWKILLLVAEARPALCYCSVLIRALLAVQMNYWQSSVATRAEDSPMQLQATKNTLELMSVGQFLPHPLNAVSDVISTFHSFHVHCVLVDIWNYMKDNVPSPVAFASNSDGALNRDFEPYKNYKNYCERLRLIMKSHVDTQADDFKRFFVDVAIKHEEDLKLAMEY